MSEQSATKKFIGLLAKELIDGLSADDRQALESGEGITFGPGGGARAEFLKKARTVSNKRVRQMHCTELLRHAIRRWDHGEITVEKRDLLLRCFTKMHEGAPDGPFPWEAPA